MTTSFIDDLQDIINGSAAPVAKAPTKPVQTYPCESCGGTGKYRGVRIHQTESDCFACGGRGWFKTSTADRFAARKAAADRKARVLQVARDQFDAAHPGLAAGLAGIREWSEFGRAMHEQIEAKGALTEKQVAAAQNLLAKVAASRAAKEAAKQANSGAVDMTAIEALFATAKANGLLKPAFVVEGMRIKPAPLTGKNAGALYVTRDGEYQGKLSGGRFIAVGGAHADTLATLVKIAVDPAGAAREFGRVTGTCCCCGRTLTDAESIAAGIGPICATKWGL